MCVQLSATIRFRVHTVGLMPARRARPLGGLRAGRRAAVGQHGHPALSCWRDGVPLLTDHYIPLTDGPCPTLLVRTPYGRGFPWDSVYGAQFAAQGFHVLLQSCRGTGGSGGTLDPWRQEVADGQATVSWLREQEWFCGALGTIGTSYLGYTAWALAASAPPELRAMVADGALAPYPFFYGSGAFAL
jgi:putative CocE/NonD family hydrolase